MASAQTGASPRAEPNPAVLQTYGMEVPTRIGLKTILPLGWTVYFQRDLVVPATISWRPGMTWVLALEQFAANNYLALRLDSTRQAVYFRTAEAALEDEARRIEVAQAATTPLPQYLPPPAPAPAEVVPIAPPPGIAVVAPVTALPVLEPLPLAAPAAPTRVAELPVEPLLLPDEPPAAALAYVPSAPTERPGKQLREPGVEAGPGWVAVPLGTSAATTVSVARARTAVRPDVAQWLETLTDSYGLALDWQAAVMAVPGPVTALGHDVVTDLVLTQRALGGPQSPLALVYAPDQQLLMARDRAPEQAPLQVQTAGRVVAVEVTAPWPNTGGLRLTVLPGESLYTQLQLLLEQSGIALRWQAPVPATAAAPLQLEADSLPGLLAQLIPLGLRATWDSRQDVVTVVAN